VQQLALELVRLALIDRSERTSLDSSGIDSLFWTMHFNPPSGNKKFGPESLSPLAYLIPRRRIFAMARLTPLISYGLSCFALGTNLDLSVFHMARVLWIHGFPALIALQNCNQVSIKVI
jgi:hypothetical protein